MNSLHRGPLKTTSRAASACRPRVGQPWRRP